MPALSVDNYSNKLLPSIGHMILHHNKKVNANIYISTYAFHESNNIGKGGRGSACAVTDNWIK